MDIWGRLVLHCFSYSPEWGDRLVTLAMKARSSNTLQCVTEGLRIWLSSSYSCMPSWDSCIYSQSYNHIIDSSILRFFQVSIHFSRLASTPGGWIRQPQALACPPPVGSNIVARRERSNRFCPSLRNELA